VEFATKNVELKNGGGIVKAQIWDTGKFNLHYLYSWSREIQGNYICVRKGVSKFRVDITEEQLERW
jgi:hypothetical protein